jgi:low affinity Fe/Cu permease
MLQFSASRKQAGGGRRAQKEGRQLSRAADQVPRRAEKMLETIAIILIVLWLLGMVSGYTLGNFIYVLLVIAIVLFLVRLISGRRVA